MIMSASFYLVRDVRLKLSNQYCLLLLHSGLTYSRVFRLPVITLTQNGAKAEKTQIVKFPFFSSVSLAN